MKRRDFVVASASIAGAMIPGLGRAGLPCPPPQINVSGGTSATTNCTPPPPSGAFPLTAGGAGRYLVGTDSRPFPLLVRTLWCIPALTQSAYQAVIDDTVQKGFTAIEFFLPHFQANGRAPFDGNGNPPFTKTLSGSDWNGSLSITPDFTTPHPNFWSHIDGIINYAASRSLMVLFFPAYTGWQPGFDGWRSEMAANGTTRMQTYGTWVAERYKNARNLVWMIGGDSGLGAGTLSFSTAEKNALQAMINGMNGVVGQQSRLFSNEWNGDSIGTDQPDFGRYISLNGCYSWDGNVTSVCRRAYAYSPALPAFLQEGPFDEEGPDGNGFNPSATQPIRRYSWWSWLSSIAGYTFGNGYVWTMNSGYTSHLNSTQTQHHAFLNNFIKSIDWWTLVPNGLGGIGTLVTAGGGTMNTTSYVAAAANSTGRLLVAYRGPGHTGSFTIDMSRMAGLATARWFDPTNGTYITIGSYANSGTRAFTPLGTNAAGAADWVLILQA